MFVLQDVLVFNYKEFTGNGPVIVSGGKTETSGPGKADVPADRNTPTYSEPGFTIMPGFIDAHIHGFSGNIDSIEHSIIFESPPFSTIYNEAENNVALNKDRT
jgi:imidazolonepropionase-like amidohydrolase